MTEFSEGDEVTWKSHGGEAVGKVKKKITSATKAGGRKVKASKGEPQYLVKATRAAAKRSTSRQP